MTDRLRQKRRENRALRNTQCEVFLLEMKFFLKKMQKKVQFVERSCIFALE